MQLSNTKIQGGNSVHWGKVLIFLENHWSCSRENSRFGEINFWRHSDWAQKAFVKGRLLTKKGHSKWFGIFISRTQDLSLDHWCDQLFRTQIKPKSCRQMYFRNQVTSLKRKHLLINEDRNVRQQALNGFHFQTDALKPIKTQSGPNHRNDQTPGTLLNILITPIHDGSQHENKQLRWCQPVKNVPGKVF
jgi:hypothetical protein